MAQKTTPTPSREAEKASPRNGSAALTDVSAAAPPSTRQEYPEVNAAIDRGLADIAAGRVSRMSFAEYADIPLDD